MDFRKELSAMWAPSRQNRFVGQLLRGAAVVWTCDHNHDDSDDAIECAEAALNCDDGSLMAERLERATRNA